jgi:hypothetical protein
MIRERTANATEAMLPSQKVFCWWMLAMVEIGWFLAVSTHRFQQIIESWGFHRMNITAK